jgi:hypothetical protein
VQESLNHCKFHLFADDLQVYHSGSADQVDRFEREVNSDLSSTVSWSRVNGLSLNVRRTQTMFVRRPTFLSMSLVCFWMGSNCRLLGF